MKSIEDAAMMLIYVERERIIDFLAGLNVEYGRIKVQALGKEDLPPLNEKEGVLCLTLQQQKVQLLSL
ncbi:hypothetical protein AAG906_017858 [Vitis piasezkii]